MASVSSLDQDMRKLRLDRYTPQAANEVRSWIEQTLGEQLPPGDLLDSLKDGVALCKYVEHTDIVFNISKLMRQACESRAPTARRQVQVIEHAVRAKREHITLPARMRDATAQPPRSRPLPDRRPL